MIHRDRLTATLEGALSYSSSACASTSRCRFTNGGRRTRHAAHARGTPRQPDFGFLHAEMWFSRTIIMVQYWRTLDQLLAYAKNKEAAHLPAWRAFNKAVGTDGSVGIWHETYVVSPDSYETIYVNMPSFGLGKAAALQPAAGGRQSASARLGRNGNFTAP